MRITQPFHYLYLLLCGCCLSACLAPPSRDDGMTTIEACQMVGGQVKTFYDGEQLYCHLRSGNVIKVRRPE